jgi:hypothetical protein
MTAAVVLAVMTAAVVWGVKTVVMEGEGGMEGRGARGVGARGVGTRGEIGEKNMV